MRLEIGIAVWVCAALLRLILNSNNKKTHEATQKSGYGYLSVVNRAVVGNDERETIPLYSQDKTVLD